MNADVIVLTNNKYLWALRPFAYLFNTYWSTLQTVYIVGFTPPDFGLPKNFNFISLDQENWPAKKWSDQLIRSLRMTPSDNAIIFLEDYWICRTADLRGVSACVDYIDRIPNALRVDLSTDRLYAGGMFDVGPFGSYDIIETPSTTPYQMSFQLGVWKKKLLLELLQPEWSPWEVEMHTSVPSTMRVLGTRQFPVRYINAINSGRGVEKDEINKLEKEHIEFINQKGWIPS